jgi:sulfopyruvate decarboxylase alpha subunit
LEGKDLRNVGLKVTLPRLKILEILEGGGVRHKSAEDIYRALLQVGIRQVAYVPDAGHTHLIQQCHANDRMKTVSLTTEEEGVAMLAGAWLGGDRGALLMQSSGAGNCINMLSVIQECRFPLLMLITMRGEWGEFNHWQVPMGSTTQAVFEISGIKVLRANTASEVREVVEAGAAQAYNALTPTAVLLSQRLIGAKVFVK